MTLFRPAEIHGDNALKTVSFITKIADGVNIPSEICFKLVFRVA